MNMDTYFDDLARYESETEHFHKDQDTENRPCEENAVNEDSVIEKKRIVKPKKIVTRPQPKLDSARLLGPRGIGILESTFSNVKLKGKGHETEDLDKILLVLEHWAHRLYPKLQFADCLSKIEELSSKRNVMTNVTKLRLGMEDNENTDETAAHMETSKDIFDQLLNE